MKRFLSLLVLFALAAPARAHFIYLLPDKDKNTAQLVFSDELAPDTAVPITKVQQTKVFARDASGKEVPVKMTQAKDHYALTAEGQAPLAIGGVCKYGVLSKGEGE